MHIMCADATAQLINTSFSGTEGGTVDVCVVGTSTGRFENALTVQLSAAPGSAGQLPD